MKVYVSLLGIGTITLLVLLGIACASSTQSAATVPVSTPASAQVAQITSPSKDDLIPRTKPAEAIQLFKDGKAVIIDVRDPGSYTIMHIKGSLNLTYQNIQEGKLEKLPKDKQLILYCTCPKEHTAALASVMLQEKGFQKVSALQDGLYGYKDAGGEVEAKS